jgi:hypothetical protein
MAWSVNAAYAGVGNTHGARPPTTCATKAGSTPTPGFTRPGGCSEDYWFDYGNARLIAYPEPYPAWTDWSTKAGAVMNAAQSDPRSLIIVSGIGRRTRGQVFPRSPDLRRILDTLGVHHPKYVLNLTGHDHNYQRSAQRGVVHTAGIGGAGLYTLGRSRGWSRMRTRSIALRFTHAHRGPRVRGPPGRVVHPGSDGHFFIPNPIRIARRSTAPTSARRPGAGPHAVTHRSRRRADPPLTATWPAATFTVGPGNGAATFSWTPRRGHRALSSLFSSTTRCMIRSGSDRPPIVAART